MSEPGDDEFDPPPPGEDETPAPIEVAEAAAAEVQGAAHAGDASAAATATDATAATAATDPAAYAAAYGYPPGYAPNSYADYYTSAYYYSAYAGEGQCMQTYVWRASGVSYQFAAMAPNALHVQNRASSYSLAASCMHFSQQHPQSSQDHVDPAGKRRRAASYQRLSAEVCSLNVWPLKACLTYVA